MNEDEALDALAEQAASHVYRMRPYDAHHGGLYDQTKTKMPLREWLKRHWRLFPNTYPRREVGALLSTQPTDLSPEPARPAPVICPCGSVERCVYPKCAEGVRRGAAQPNPTWPTGGRYIGLKG